MTPRKGPEPRRGQLLLECLEGRQMLAGDVELFATEGSPIEPPANHAAETNSTLDASSLVAEGEPEPDLVAFAKALKDAGVIFYGAAWCPFCTEQKELFEDGGRELPFVEVTNPDRSLNEIGQDNNIETFPTWEFPDSTRATGVLTLAELSERSGVAIPTGETPSFASIGSQTVRIGSPVHLGIDAYDPNGGPLTVTVSVDDPDLLEAVVLQGNRSLRLDVQGYGEMVFELFENRAPRPAGRVIELAESGFYEGVRFHRVIDNFVLQAGDPTGTGSGGSSLGNFDDQFHPDLRHTSTGVLSFAKSADDTNDSQFFITEGATQHLDFNHSIFGQLVEGEPVREAISETEVDDSDRPTNEIVINSASVFGDQENSVVMLKATGNGTGNTSVTITVTDAEGNSSSEVVPVTIDNATSNAPPFLEDIDPVVSSAGTPVTFPLSAVDVEGDPVEYFAAVAEEDESGATVTVDQTTGEVTVTPPENFSGQVVVHVGVAPAEGATQAELDTQVVPVTFAAAAPTAIDLIDASDSGISNTDNITNVASMTFVVSGVTAGATVELLADGTVVGTGAATGSTVSITTNNISTLGDGSYRLTARQRGSDGINSGESPALTVVYDSTNPVAVNTNVPTRANVDSPFVVNLGHPEEGEGLRYALTNAPEGATIDAETGVLQWTPTESQAGEQTITISLTDAAGNVRAQSFDVTVGEEVIAEINLGITDLDGNPISELRIGEEFLVNFSATDSRGVAAEGVFAAFADIVFDGTLVEPVPGASIQYSDNFTAPSGTIEDGLINELGAVSSSTVPTNNSLSQIATIRMRTIAAGQAIFTSDPPEGNGTELLLYSRDDAVPEESIGFGTVSLTVKEAFTASDDAFNVDMGSSENLLDVLANDGSPDAGETLTITAIGSSSSDGVVEIDADESAILYTPAAGFTGTDSFTYTVSDGTTTSEATVTVTVGDPDALPIAVNDAFTIAEDFFDPDSDPDSDAEFDVLANDEPGDPSKTISLDSVGSSANGATVRLSDDGTKLFYVPPQDFFGTDTVTYTIVDSSGAEDTATVTFTVTPVNDPPPAEEITRTVLTGSEGTTVATLDDIGTNVDGDDEVVTFTAVGSTSASGTVEISGDATSITYTPPSASFIGEDTFTYTVTDEGGEENTGTITINVREFQPRSFTLSFDSASAGTLEQILPVTLRGTTDFGETIETTATVSESGKVVFADQAPGEYEIEIPAMPFLAGGENPQKFQIDSNLDDGDVDDLVAHIGPLLPKYVSTRDYLITSPDQSILAAIEPGKESIWVLPTGDLNGLSSPKLSLNEDGSEFDLEITDDNGDTQRASLPITDAETIDLREQVGSVQLVRVNVSPDVVDYSPGISSDNSNGSAAGTQPEGEGSGASSMAAPLQNAMAGEGEAVARSTHTSAASDLATIAAQRTSALDAAFADVADVESRPTAAEGLLTEETNGNEVDSDAVDAVVSLLSEETDD